MSKNTLKGSPTQDIVDTINLFGLQATAQQLGTSAATLSRWLKSQNYKLKRIYVKQEGKES